MQTLKKVGTFDTKNDLNYKKFRLRNRPKLSQQRSY